ncbi:unnamed protein product [Fraxinus pennsylvanica]|uniref:Uncharacterized protein n=1 Tax=Fraxinus pennsylvanica TaxID=56036 RepID=A0AAD2DLH9_9LAMI|nr:unnamed protein product [Fraxinus pennsylvanica]
MIANGHRNGILIIRRRSLELLKGLSLGRDDSVNISPLKQEVLVVWGEQDEIFLLEKAHELKELQGEKARLEVIKNTSHLPQLEYSAKFNNVSDPPVFGAHFPLRLSLQETQIHTAFSPSPFPSLDWV